MRILQSPRKEQGKTPSSVIFLGGVVMGAVVVVGMMNQNQAKNYNLTTITTSSATYAAVPATAPGGVRATYQEVRESSSSEEKPIGGTPSGAMGESDGVNIESYERASRDSGGFFDDISDESWALMKQRVNTRINHYDPNDPNRGINQPNAWYQENFEPDFTCAHERRIGGMGDGPKWVCDPHRLKKKDCLIYSVGSEGNFMFENSVIKEIGKHCEIHTFDPEIQGRPYGHLAPAGVNYHNWGFMSETEGKLAQAKYDRNVHRAGGNFKTMKQTIEELGHGGREIDIFKIDCEGCEWTTYQGWFNSGATLRQILVEVHNTPADTVNKFFTGVQDAGYVTFHKEPNIQWAGGSCVEYAFLKLEKSFYEVA